MINKLSFTKPKIKKEWMKFFSVSRLVVITFFGQPLGVIMAFIAPVVMLVIIPFLMNGISNVAMKTTLSQLIPGLILTPTILITTLAVPMVYSAMKEAGMLKKMNVLGIKPGVFLTSLIMVFLLIIIISTLFIYCLAFAIWQKDVPTPSGASIIIPFIILIISGMSLGLAISNISKSQAIAFAMGVAAYIPITFMSGLVFPEAHGWIKGASKFLPHTHSIDLFKIGWHTNSLEVHEYYDGSLVFSPESLKWVENLINPKIFSGNNADTALSYTYPLLFITSQITIIIFRFKWE